MSGPRVLIVWEFGGGLGHIASMLPVIRALRAGGIEPVYSVPDPAAARKLLGEEAPRLIRGVPPPARFDVRHAPVSFADILLQGGFRDRGSLAAAVTAWRTLFEQEKVDALLLDFALVAQLAGWLMGLRMVSCATPFAIPPVPIPGFNVRRKNGRTAVDAERELLECVNSVIVRAGHAPIGNLTPWLHAPTRFLTCVPQANVYDFEPDGGYLGAIGEIAATEEVEWKSTGRTRVLCYLKWSRETPNLLRSLDHPDRDMICLIPGASQAWFRALPLSRIRVFSKPVTWKPLVQDADVVVSNASVGIACEALMAGKPQLMLPVDREKALITERLAGLGVAVAVEAHQPPMLAASGLKRLLENPVHAASAKSCAAELNKQSWRTSVRSVRLALG